MEPDWQKIPELRCTTCHKSWRDCNLDDEEIAVLCMPDDENTPWYQSREHAIETFQCGECFWPEFDLYVQEFQARQAGQIH